MFNEQYVEALRVGWTRAANPETDAGRAALLSLAEMNSAVDCPDAREAARRIRESLAHKKG